MFMNPLPQTNYESGGGGTSSDTGLASAGANGRIRILYVGP